MMKILALDISSMTGYAILNGKFGERPTIENYGNVANTLRVLEFGKYPYCYIDAAYNISRELLRLISETDPDQIVIEETNKSKNRWSQKLLEFIHCTLLIQIRPLGIPVTYISSSIWRRNVGIALTKADKKANATLSKAKRDAAKTGKKLDKKALGIFGKVSKKHAAVRYVNSVYEMKFKQKDNDVAEAICLGEAFLGKAVASNGK